jgi:hypothetical protein
MDERSGCPSRCGTILGKARKVPARVTDNDAPKREKSGAAAVAAVKITMTRDTADGRASQYHTGAGVAFATGRQARARRI